jgi:hypothetical protein
MKSILYTAATRFSDEDYRLGDLVETSRPSAAGDNFFWIIGKPDPFTLRLEPVSRFMLLMIHVRQWFRKNRWIYNRRP